MNSVADATDQPIAIPIVVVAVDVDVDITLAVVPLVEGRVAMYEVPSVPLLSIDL